MNDKLDSDCTDFIFRPRLNALLEQAVKKPLAIVCADTGYGKTRAVADFMRESGLPHAWIRLSEADNISQRFWDNFNRSLSRVDGAAYKGMTDTDFPDTDDRLNQYFETLNTRMPSRPRVIILDDAHLIRDPAALRFLEFLARRHDENISVIMVCRILPNINIADLRSKGLIYNISEDDLCFTKDELAAYLRQQGISAEPQTLFSILEDTHGWAFAVNLIAQSMKKSPGYSGYVRSAMRCNIFELMEADVWNTISEPLRRLLARLSLLRHFSADLTGLLAEWNDRLIEELRKINAYVRFDKYRGIWMIHPLFLEFLRAKQDILSDDDKAKTHKAAADWCGQNGYTADAVSYYEKAGDYGSIIRTLFDLRLYLPRDMAAHTLDIFERAPQDTFRRVDFFAALYLYALICAGRWQEIFVLAGRYEQELISLPETNPLRNHTLGGIYGCLGCARVLMSVSDNVYDFSAYYAKMDEYLSKTPVNPGSSINFPIGAPAAALGDAKAGAPREYIEAVKISSYHISHCLDGSMAGLADLCAGELLFYQGKVQEAESAIYTALDHAKKYHQFEIIHRSLFYIMRIAVFQGNRSKAQKALTETEALLNEKNYPTRFITYDIAMGWYQYILRARKQIPDWLKERFAPYDHACSIENFGNQMKARYHYLVKNYQPLLAYIDEMKRRESILYARIEMLAMEACVRYKTKDRDGAFASLREAYKTASPNGIVMPFIELGKDMRTLTTALIKAANGGIPQLWLKSIRNQSVFYVKNQSKIINELNADHADHINDRDSVLSSRENDVLRELYNGFSRSQAAANLSLPVDTVNTHIKSIYRKLNANNIADLVRIAAEQKLV